eukprot:6125373-Pleurochrysis_carterae.AAC.4
MILPTPSSASLGASGPAIAAGAAAAGAAIAGASFVRRWRGYRTTEMTHIGLYLESTRTDEQ